MKHLVFYILFGASVCCAAQHVEEQASLLDDSLSKFETSGRSYPLFVDGEEHSSFLVSYLNSERLQIDLEGFYDTYMLANRFKTYVAAKYYLNDALYLFSGLDMEMDIDKYGGKPSAPRVGVVGGMGYEVNEQWMIEARSNIQSNTSKTGLFGESQRATPAVFTFGSKFKF